MAWAAVRSKAGVLLLYVLLCVTLCPFWFCSRLGGEGVGWLLCLVCLLGVSLLLCGSSSRAMGLSAVCDCGIF